MIVALDADASWMSFSVMPPTPRWTNAIFTSSRSSLREALGERFERTVTSALTMRLSVAASPAWICSKMSSSRAPPAIACASRAEAGQPLPVLTGLGDVAGRLLVGRDDEVVAGLGDVVEAEHLRPASTGRPP